MLDTRARGKLELLFDKCSVFFISLGLKPTHVTLLALFIGVGAAFSYYVGLPIALTVALVWFSGFLDAVDGNMARRTGKTSKLGTLMDIVFDRVVEISFIFAIGLKHKEALLALLFLSCAIVITMSVFLTTASLVKNDGKKSFHYQAGLMERTEGFIMFTFMMIFSEYIVFLTYLFGVLVLFTAVQRFFAANKMFKKEAGDAAVNSNKTQETSRYR